MVEVPAARQRGFGELRCTSPEGRRTLPLAGVTLRAKVADRVAEVTVEQRFQNPFAQALEATYIFPLAGGSAVSRFELQVGARILKGKVDERGQAREQYQRALAQGKRAALLEQERDDVFTVQVGNLPPGEEVIVRLAYAEKLPFFEDGTTELRLPLVVAPRYIAGAAIDTPENAGRGTEDDTDRVQDASRITPPRLAPGFDPKVALQLSVELLHGAGAGAMGLAELSCSQHATRLASGPETALVSLAREQEPLDRDFVLRWRVAGEKVVSTLLVHRGAEGEGYGLLSIVPPRQRALAAPRDVVFVVDRSGSMDGEKMASAARACSTLLETLGPRDRFALQAFDNDIEWFELAPTPRGGPVLVAADQASVEKGKKWLRGIEARGGTEVTQALGAALQLAAGKSAEQRTAVVVLLTDGEVGDESTALKQVQESLGGARVFTVGIDTAVNDGFLKRLAALGRGTASFVEPGAQLEQALVAIAREIGAPVAVDLQIEADEGAGGVELASLAPARLPDLFAGRAATCSLRLPAARNGRARSKKAAEPISVRVTGRYADGSKLSLTVEVREAGLPALAQLWARARVADLEDRFRIAPGPEREVLKDEIVALAIRHTLLTRFTAFVVVDESEVVNPSGLQQQVTQPVQMPAGWAANTQMAPPASPTRALSASSGSPMAQAPAVEARRKSPSPQQRFTPSQPAKEELSAPEDALAEAAFDFDGAVHIGGAFSAGGAGAAKGLAQGAASPPVPVPALTAEDAKALAALLAQLSAALAAARSELAAGRVPSADALEAARSALLRLPALGMFGALGRFVRASLYALIAALRMPGAKARELGALAALHGAELQRASAEIAPAAGSEGAPDRFWEGSI